MAVSGFNNSLGTDPELECTVDQEVLLAAYLFCVSGSEYTEATDS